ncbi:glycosyltransferase family 2 protein [Maricaulis sp. CAU 1757]
MPLPSEPARPRVSVVVIAYNMAREIPRTVTSLLPPYQTGLADGDVEVIVIDNGSPHPVSEADRAAWPDCVRYHFVEDASASPARALNEGVAMAQADWVGVLIDGARMLSPGVLSLSLQARSLSPRAVVGTLGFHLGPKPQQISTREGYDQAEEDRLLASINWPGDGYRLFDIAALGQSARLGWFGHIAESNAVFLSKDLYQMEGGYDEAFTIPGGGIVNLDFFKRLTENPDNLYVLLYGEGSFHQHHGGVTTSRPVSEPDPETGTKTTWQRYVDNYRDIRGVDYDFPRRRPLMLGEHCPPVMRAVERMVAEMAEARARS